MVITLAVLTVRVSAWPAPPQDIVRTLMPEDAPLKKVPAGNVPRDTAVQQLNAEKKSATGKRAEKIAFLLAVFNSDYAQNRDFLLRILNGCTAPASNVRCDEDAGQYLVSLYRRDHRELLPFLLNAGGTRHAPLAELLGSFYSSLITRTPEVFMNGIKPRPPAEQQRLCYMAGAGDGSGMPAKDLEQVRKTLRGLGNDGARQCLKQVEEANKKL
jgi:hypothetical protein